MEADDYLSPPLWPCSPRNSWFAVGCFCVPISVGLIRKDIDLDLTFGEYNIVHLLAPKMGHSLTYRVIYDELNMRVSLPDAGSRVIGRMGGP